MVPEGLWMDMPGGPKTIKIIGFWKDHYFSRDLFHQQFQGTGLSLPGFVAFCVIFSARFRLGKYWGVFLVVLLSTTILWPRDTQPKENDASGKSNVLSFSPPEIT